MDFLKANAFTDLTNDAFRNPLKYDNHMVDYYELGSLNCHSAAILSSNGINPVGRKSITDFERNIIIMKSYKNVPSEEAIFGETLVTNGDLHTSVYFGEDNKGNVYLYSTNGAGASPKIMKTNAFTDYLEPESTYGAVRNIYLNKEKYSNTVGKKVDRFGRLGNGGSGLYNLKKR